MKDTTVPIALLAMTDTRSRLPRIHAEQRLDRGGARPRDDEADVREVMCTRGTGRSDSCCPRRSLVVFQPEGDVVHGRLYRPCAGTGFAGGR